MSSFGTILAVPIKFELFNLSCINATSVSEVIILSNKYGCATVSVNVKQIKVTPMIPTAILLYFFVCKLNSFIDSNTTYIIKVEVKRIMSLDKYNKISETTANDTNIFIVFKRFISNLFKSDIKVMIYAKTASRFKSKCK
ncbi:MAG: hypothetical protein ACLU8Y_05975 [Clostridia bacterium]